LVFGLLMKVTNLPTFLKFGNAKKSDICVIFVKKILSGLETGEGVGAGAKLGGVPPFPTRA